MNVTEFGIITEERPLQPQNASIPIAVTVFGIVVLLQP
jgi:hypothetical protein